MIISVNTNQNNKLEQQPPFSEIKLEIAYHLSEWKRNINEMSNDSR